MNGRREIANGLFVCSNGVVLRVSHAPVECSYYEKDPEKVGELKDRSCKYCRKSGPYYKCCPPHYVKREMKIEAKLEEL